MWMPASSLDEVTLKGSPAPLLDDGLRCALLLLLAALVGTMFGVWVGFDPSYLSARAYIEQQQNAIRSLNALLPLIGLLSIVLVGILAFRSVRPRVRYLLVAAAICLIVAGLITRFGNQPINALVLHWTPDAPPPDWSTWRDRWWHLHQIRTVFGVAAYVLVVLSMLAKRR